MLLHHRLWGKWRAASNHSYCKQHKVTWYVYLECFKLTFCHQSEEENSSNGVEACGVGFVWVEAVLVGVACGQLLQ